MRKRGVSPGRRGTYDTLSSGYELIADRAERRARERGLAALQVRPGESVLEIGAGTGRALVRLSSAAGATGLVCGLDASTGMLRLARRRLAAGPRRVHLLQADARALPCQAASFAAVFMSFTLELFDDRGIGVVLEETKRVLRAGGRVVIVCLATTPRPSVMMSAYGWLHGQLPHLVDCRPIPVRAWLERSGYRVRRYEAMDLWGLPVAVVSAETSRVRSAGLRRPMKSG